MKQSGCIEVFTELLKLFLLALNAPAHRQMLHTGVRQYLHRMVVCLEKEILPFIPIILENLLKQPEVRELYDFIPLLNQLTMKFKVSRAQGQGSSNVMSKARIPSGLKLCQDQC